jgi:hypothetical protein
MNLSLSNVEKLDLEVAIAGRIASLSRVRQHLDDLELTQTNNEIISTWTTVQCDSLAGHSLPYLAWLPLSSSTRTTPATPATPAAPK